MNNNNSGFVYVADIQLSPAARDTYTAVDHLCLDMALNPDARHANGTLFNFNLRKGERALITSFWVTYCVSDFDVPITVSFHRLYDDGGGGDVTFVVPARAFGSVPHRDQLLYRSKCLLLQPDAFAFIGTEHSILYRRSTAIVPDTHEELRDWCYFKMEDPFATFLLRNRGLFKDVTQDDIRMTKTPSSLVQIRESAVDRVHRFFERELFPLFAYTTRQSIEFKTVGQVPVTASGSGSSGFQGIILHFKCEYHVVAQCVPSFTVAAGEKF